MDTNSTKRHGGSQCIRGGLVPGGTIDQQISEAEKKVAELRQILQGVAYCRSHSMCHRDLKLENILLDATGQVLKASRPLSARVLVIIVDCCAFAVIALGRRACRIPSTGVSNSLSTGIHLLRIPIPIAELWERGAAEASDSETSVEEADDAEDTKAEFIKLILVHERADTSKLDALRVELLATKTSLLRKKAIAADVARAEIDAADDAADTKLALVELLLAAQPDESLT